MAVRRGRYGDCVMANADFWLGKRVLLTGHTGFKGGWLALWLQQKGAIVCGIALAPETQPNLFALARIDNSIAQSHFIDIRNATLLAQCVRNFQPEIVFHLAAQPLVRASYREPLATFATNVLGTANLLDALRGLDSARVALIVTTDKVYQNPENAMAFVETDRLGGHDPYSASKAASEIVVASYRDAFLAAQGVAVATARAGNVIGGGDWSAERLIPDAVRAWQNGQPLVIRHPQAVRPWQHVLEPLAGYMQLAQKLWDAPGLAGAYNFGPDTAAAATVGLVVECAAKAYNSCTSSYENHSRAVVHLAADSGSKALHEAQLLTLDTTKAATCLGVQPRWALDVAVARTLHWYQAVAAGADARALCQADIAEYEVSPHLGAAA